MRINITFNEKESTKIDNAALKLAMMINPNTSMIDAASKINEVKQNGFKQLDPNCNASLTHEKGYTMDIRLSTVAGEACIGVVDKLIDLVAPLTKLFTNTMNDITTMMEDSTIEFHELGELRGRQVVFIDAPKHYLEADMLEPFIEQNTLFLIGPSTHSMLFINLGVDDYLRVGTLDDAIEKYEEMVQLEEEIAAEEESIDQYDDVEENEEV